jgi:hypothetical protein
MPWHEAHMQTLFNWTQAIHYFTVTLSDTPPRPLSPGITPAAIIITTTTTTTTPPRTTDNIITASLQRLQQLIKPPQRTQLDAVCHISDLNPWFTQTGIYAHLQELDLSQLGASY